MIKAIRKREISIWGLLLAGFVFLSPLEPFLNTSTAGSLVKFYALGCIALFSVKTFMLGRIKKPLPVQILLALFLFMMVMSIGWSGHVNRGLDLLMAMGLQVVFILIVSQIDYTDTEKQVFLNIYILSSLVLCALVFLNAEKLMMGERGSASVPEGSDIDPNNIGAYIVAGFAALLNIDANIKRKSISKCFKLAFQVVYVIAIFMTVSRGAVVALLLIIVYNMVNKGKVKRAVFFLVTIAIIFFVVYYLGQYLFGSYNPVNLLIERFVTDEGGSGRIDLWRISFKAILEKPFFGYGLGESPYIIGRTNAENIGSHNTFITIWFEAGIFAFIVFVSMLISLWRSNKKTMYDISVYSMLLGALTTSFFIDTYNKKILWLPILLCTIGALSNRHKRIMRKNR